MKTIIFFALLVSATYNCSAQSIDWSAVRQRYIEKYEPQKVPAWLFPMIFKEGNGGRDTVYFGYDSLAENFSVLGNDYFDTLLGEKPELADTSAFYAYVADFLDLPSIIKVDLEPANYLAFEMAFHNGILPVTIYWDVSAFRSDSLPYPDLYPAPRAQGLLGFDLPMTAWGDSAQTLFCPFSAPLLVTDTIYSYGACWASDSVQFFDIFGNQNVPIGYMGFGVFPWTGRWVAINTPSDEQDIKIFPSPANDLIKIMSSLKGKITMAVTDIFGQQQLSASFFQYSSTLTLDVSSLHSGIYFLHIKDATEFYSQKIVIVH